MSMYQRSRVEELACKSGALDLQASSLLLRSSPTVFAVKLDSLEDQVQEPVRNIQKVPMTLHVYG
eukprot:3682406-Amphidinium_carterae.1